jgi:predicted O-methyltransferase YrrM
MLSGHFQGRVLSMLAKLIRPMNILEIGTYTGYSALCFAKECKKTEYYTIDIKEELVDFKESILTNRLGNADHTTPR